MHKTSSLSEYIKVVSAITADWTKRDGNFIYPWFRGMSSENYELLPGLYRKSVNNREDEYRREFQRKGYPFLADTTYGVPSTDWEWYFVMQHYGMPTRLLDWSEGGLIALYFALFYRTEREKGDPCVWMMNPFGVNSVFHGLHEVFFFTHDYVTPYLKPIWSKEELPENPIAFDPCFKSRRIAVQKGCFTIHGKNAVPLNELPGMEPWLIKIRIDLDSVSEVKDQMIVAGITESLLFPELNGLSRELKEYFRKE